MVEPSATEALSALLMGNRTSGTSDTARADIVRELMGKENINRVSEVSNFDIAMLSAGKAVNAKAKSPVFDAFYEAFLELRVSHERNGRKEVVDISRPHLIEGGAVRPNWKFW